MACMPLLGHSRPGPAQPRPYDRRRGLLHRAAPMGVDVDRRGEVGMAERLAHDRDFDPACEPGRVRQWLGAVEAAMVGPRFIASRNADPLTGADPATRGGRADHCEVGPIHDPHRHAAGAEPSGLVSQPRATRQGCHNECGDRGADTWRSSRLGAPGCTGRPSCQARSFAGSCGWSGFSLGFASAGRGFGTGCASTGRGFGLGCASLGRGFGLRPGEVCSHRQLPGLCSRQRDRLHAQRLHPYLAWQHCRTKQDRSHRSRQRHRQLLIHRHE